jgi:Xaa-Pro dipeptidase
LPDLPDTIEVQTFNAEDQLLTAVARDVERINHVAYVGPSPRAAANLPATDVNPGQLINHVHFGRATKTAFELSCMRKASEIAARGHLAARDVFHGGGSEFEIHQAYLSASQQTEAELPYPNIIALNEHAGVLHYQHYDRHPPSQRLSFLIDAGGRFRGYAADVTRSYAATQDTLMAALIAQLDVAQRTLIDQIRPGLDYLELHEQMHRAVAAILVDAGLVRGDPEAAFSDGLTDHFFPHGLGHLIGLQTHDVGGHLASSAGGQKAPPARHPALRLTRTIEVDQVFTIEPGVYFIPSLLDQLRGRPEGSRVNWSAVSALLSAGGVRIEDNVRVLATGVENFTRDAFSSLENDAA